MKLLKIPKDKLDEYKEKLIFDCYNWNLKFEDYDSVSDYVLVLSKDENNLIKSITMQLDEELKGTQEVILNNKNIMKRLKLPKKIFNAFSDSERSYDISNKNSLRFLRYDFHPCTDGTWKVTEVNSDIPGGFPESSILPVVARDLLNIRGLTFVSIVDELVRAINMRLSKEDTIMILFDTTYTIDEQVVRCLGDALINEGYNVLYGVTDQALFDNDGNCFYVDGTKINFIFRFISIRAMYETFPELFDIYMKNYMILCNDPICIFSESKNFPLVWKYIEDAGGSMNVWKKYMPKTYDSSLLNIILKDKEKIVFKPIYGMSGERIVMFQEKNVREYIKKFMLFMIHRKDFVIQEKIESMPIKSEDGAKFHLCLGSYVVNDKHAGYYARISKFPIIDNRAMDVPVLIDEEGVLND